MLIKHQIKIIAKSSGMKRNIICIVDDDKVYQFTTTKTIEKLNLVDKILSFFDGSQLYAYIQQHIAEEEMLPDVILLDINMPFMDAWQFLDEFENICRQLPKEITLYIISSSISERDILKARSYHHVKDYLVKPIQMGKYAEILATNVNKKTP